jgi:hypothetical protein
VDWSATDLPVCTNFMDGIVYEREIVRRPKPMNDTNVSVHSAAQNSEFGMFSVYA